jgi:hypothetical protein
MMSPVDGDPNTNATPANTKKSCNPSLIAQPLLVSIAYDIPGKKMAVPPDLRFQGFRI